MSDPLGLPVIERLQLAMEASRSFVFEWVCDFGDLVWHSASSRVVLGHAGEVEGPADPGQGCYRHLAPEDRKRFDDWVKGSKPGAESFRKEYERSLGNGQILLMEDVGRAFFDTEGRLRGLIGMSTDITERRVTDPDVLQAHIKYQRLMEANIFGVVVGEASGGILEANDYYLSLLGRTRSDLAAGTVNWREATPPEWLPVYDDAVSQLKTKGHVSPYEKEYQRPDGSRAPVLVADTLLPDTEGQGRVLSVALDFSARKRLETELREIASTDPLTGALNRRCMKEAMEAEARRARRHGRSLALVMLDIDHFKKINDTHGHDQGDEVLKAIVAQLKGRLRGDDTVARWGGEEIMILLPETHLDQAAGLAETLRAGLHALSRLGVGPVSASFGVAGYRQDETLEQWIKCVDDLVYQAKREGRDRVCFRPE